LAHPVDAVRCGAVHHAVTFRWQAH